MMDTTNTAAPALPPSAKPIDPMKGIAQAKSVAGSGLSPGLCDGDFTGGEYLPADGVRRQYDSIRLTWRITTGPDAGKTTDREVGISLKPGSPRLRISSDLLGRDLPPGEAFDLSPMVGRKYRLRLAKKARKDGTVSEWVHVESCVLLG